MSKLTLYIFLLTWLCCLSLTLHAQSVKGIVFKKNTAERVSQVLISNSSGAMMMTDDLGMYSIKASAGDTLTFTRKGYTPQKQVVINNSDLLIYLQPAVVLDDVVIKGQTKQQELAEVMNTYRSKGIYYNGRPPALSFLSAPLTGFYELFGKEPGRARHFNQYIKNETEQSFVNRKFNKELVKQVTQLDDAETEKFMNNFRPAYEDLKKWTDYELIGYIKRSLEYYKKNGDKPALKTLY